jgi:DHA1 family multidrug resistance protein-like MFS transporter
MTLERRRKINYDKKLRVEGPLIMREIFRDSALGQIFRLLGWRTFLRYPEEDPNFVLPEGFQLDAPSSAFIAPEENSERLRAQIQLEDVEAHTDSLDSSLPRQASSEQPEHEKEESLVLRPTKTKDGKILVTWYTTDDTENPQNWSSIKKLWVTSLIEYIYTANGSTIED